MIGATPLSAQALGAHVRPKTNGRIVRIKGRCEVQTTVRGSDQSSAVAAQNNETVIATQAAATGGCTQM